MLLGPKFQAFIEASPVCVMIRGTLERVLRPDAVETVFTDNAASQYTRQITFAQCIQIMDAVVFRTQPSIGAWFTTHGDSIAGTRQAVYDKIKRVEPAVSAALVHYAADELHKCLRPLKHLPAAPVPGYRLRVLDGNHLAGTERRLKVLNNTTAAALPGKSLVLYDPRYDLITDLVPCEDAYTQERALLDQVVPRIARNDCVVADRGFCTMGFLFALPRRGAAFVIRQHAGLTYRPIGKARPAGTDDKNRKIQQQRVKLIDPIRGETQTVRRITLPLPAGNKRGETELHILTNLTDREATAKAVATVYAQRWTIENAFQQLTTDLRCEIDTLAYPRAALFGFALACVSYNAVALAKAAIRADRGPDFVRDDLSMYYLTLEVARVACGMAIAIGEKAWRIFHRMSAAEFRATILDLAKHLKAEKYKKHKRGPKKPPKKKTGVKFPHVCTARLLAEQR